MASGKTANKSEIARLRERMLAEGFDRAAIAAAIMRGYGYRPDQRLRTLAG